VRPTDPYTSWESPSAACWPWRWRLCTPPSSTASSSSTLPPATRSPYGQASGPCCRVSRRYAQGFISRQRQRANFSFELPRKALDLIYCVQLLYE